MTGGSAKIAVVLQGPVQRSVNGYSTFALLDRLNASPWRERLHVVSVAWDDDDREGIGGLSARADEVVLATKPEARGAGNRNLQRTAVTAGLDVLDGHGFRHVLKSRHDVLLSERVLSEVVSRADRGFERIFVTNLHTKWETFHVSDMVLFSTFENVRAWFDPREVYYQDLLSPEVQFARVFVRNRRLPYPFTQAGYLAFLRDWVEMIDWGESGLVWFRAPALTRADVNRGIRLTADHDCGPYMNRVLPGDYPDRLRRHRSPGPLRLRAAAHLVADALLSYAVVEAEHLVHTLRLTPRLRTVRLPRGHALVVKLGVAAKRYTRYTVDPAGAEQAKPVGTEIAPASRSEATAALAAALPPPPPPPPDELVSWWVGTPLFAVAHRRPNRAARTS